MPKNIEDIIVPERKKSIRNVPIPEGRRKNNNHVISPVSREHYPPSASYDGLGMFHRENGKPPRISRKSTWVAVGLALLVLLFALLSIFDDSTLAYVPKSAALSFGDDIYTATKSGEGELFYSLVKVSGDKGLSVTAVGEEEVSRKAGGVIVVYNDASTEPQRLIKETRFQTPSGLVYRIPEAIVIPGRRTIAGVVQPGAVETIVYADEAGEKYNIGLSDFTVPGLAGTARFATIYARAKTGMTGGFVGVEKVVNSQEEVQARGQLETTLREELISLANVQVPEDFILLPSLSVVTFEHLPQTSSAGKDNVTINTRGHLYGVMFKKNELSTHLARGKVALAPGESVDLIELDSLNFAFTGDLPADLLSANKIRFSVRGEAMAVWRTDEIALKTDLIGKHKRDVYSILNNYPTVVSATVTIRPFWKNSFPDDGSRISMKKVLVK